MSVTYYVIYAQTSPQMFDFNGCNDSTAPQHPIYRIIENIINLYITSEKPGYILSRESIFLLRAHAVLTPFYGLHIRSEADLEAWYILLAESIFKA